MKTVGYVRLAEYLDHWGLESFRGASNGSCPRSSVCEHVQVFLPRVGCTSTDTLLASLIRVAVENNMSYS